MGGGASRAQCGRRSKQRRGFFTSFGDGEQESVEAIRPFHSGQRSSMRRRPFKASPIRPSSANNTASESSKLRSAGASTIAWDNMRAASAKRPYPASSSAASSTSCGRAPGQTRAPASSCCASSARFVLDSIRAFRSWNSPWRLAAGICSRASSATPAPLVWSNARARSSGA